MYAVKILKIIWIIASIFILCSFAVLFAGCNSIGKPVDQSILEYQARVTELENRNSDLADRVSQYDRLIDRTVGRLETIGERAAGIADTIARIEYLFTEYERAVLDFIREANQARGAE